MKKQHGGENIPVFLLFLLKFCWEFWKNTPFCSTHTFNLYDNYFDLDYR